MTLESIELPPGEKAILSLQLPAEFLIVFDPVTHRRSSSTSRASRRASGRALAVVINVSPPSGTVELRPGPLRLTLENHADRGRCPGSGSPATRSTSCSAGAGRS